MEYFDIRTVLSKEALRNSSIRKECKEFDGKIPKAIGEMLVKENSNPDYTIFIHRTRNGERDEIFNEGLDIKGGNSLNDDTMSSFPKSKILNSMTLLERVRDAWSYKLQYPDGTRRDDSKTARCIIAKIPNTAIEYVEGKSKPILRQLERTAEQGGIVIPGEHQTQLLPEYILGSIEFEEDKIVGFEENPNYKNIHAHSNEGLVCPYELIYSFRKNHGILKKGESIKEWLKNREAKRKENSKISQTIKEQNDEYMLEHPEEYIEPEVDTTKRTESDIKQYSKKEMLFSKFNQMAKKIKDFFTKDKAKEDQLDVDRK